MSVLNFFRDICFTYISSRKLSWLSWSHHFESFTEATMPWLTAMKYLCRKWPRICSTCRKHFRSFPHSLNLAKLSRRVPLVEQELLTLPKHLSSSPFYVHCLSFFLCPLRCLSLFNLWVLITPLVLSSVSYNGNAKQLIS